MNAPTLIVPSDSLGQIILISTFESIDRTAVPVVLALFGHRDQSVKKAWKAMTMKVYLKPTIPQSLTLTKKKVVTSYSLVILINILPVLHPPLVFDNNKSSRWRTIVSAKIMLHAANCAFKFNT